MSAREVVCWVAFLEAMAVGGRADDLMVMIERAKVFGATHIALRIGDAGRMDVGSHRGGKPAKDLIDFIHGSGLKIKTWHFEYANHPTASRAVIAPWAEYADEHIINAEFEYLVSPRWQVEQLVSDIRAMGSWRVSHAPPDYAGARGDGALAILDELCDRVYPQVYSFEHDDRGSPAHLDAVHALYMKRPMGVSKVSPIGCTYRPRVRGFDPVTKRPIPLRPIGDAKVANDVIAFLSHPWTMAADAVHLYSLDAMTFAGEGGQAVLDAVKAMPSKAWLDEPIAYGDVPEIPSLEDFLASLSDNVRRFAA